MIREHQRLASPLQALLVSVLERPKSKSTQASFHSMKPVGFPLCNPMSRSPAARICRQPHFLSKCMGAEYRIFSHFAGAIFEFIFIQDFLYRIAGVASATFFSSHSWLPRFGDARAPRAGRFLEITGTTMIDKQLRQLAGANPTFEDLRVNDIENGQVDAHPHVKYNAPRHTSCPHR